MIQGDYVIFTDDEISAMRAALDSYRQGPGYVPGRWKVSDYNRRPDLRGNFPEAVRIRDITLRVAEQMSTVTLSHEERLELIRALAAAGVTEIQTSAFGRNHDVKEMREEVDAAKAIKPDCEILYGGVGRVEDLDWAAAAGIDAVHMWTAFYLGGAMPAYSGAVYHRAWQGRDWKNLNFPSGIADQIERTKRMAGEGLKRGVRVGGGIMLLSYATDEYIAEYCSSVADAGLYDVLMGDHSSAVSPEAFAHFVEVAKQAAPGLRISVHTHDMYGLANGTALAAARAGADTIDVSVDGFTEGPAQADMAHIVTALEVLYGVSTGVKLEALTPLARLTEKLFGASRPGDWGLTGPDVFTHGEGDANGEIKVDPLIHNSIVPEVIGNEPRMVLARTSGPYNMWDKLTELGFKVQKEQVMPVLDACKQEMARRGRGLTDPEITEVAQNVLGEYEEALS